jgi:hypothetical protein
MMIVRRIAACGLLVVGVIIFVFALEVGMPNSVSSAPNNEAGFTNTDELADAAVHLSKERNISIKEAEERISWQDKADILTEELISEFSNQSFGGVWINGSTDRVQIGVLNSSAKNASPRAVLEDKVREFDLEGAVDYVTVDQSYGELESIRDLAFKVFEENRDKSQDPFQFGIKPSKNSVIIHTPDAEKLTKLQVSIVKEIKEKYGDSVIFATYPDAPKPFASCNWWFCDSPLRGGVGLKRYADGYNETWCTAGFNVIGDTGTRYVVTAGHCNDSNGWATETYNYALKKIGPVHSTLMDNSGENRLDAMLIEIKEDTYNWDVMGKVYARSGDSNTGLNGYGPPSYNEEYDISSVHGVNSTSLEGERVCVSGAIMGGYPSEPNGGSCGAVHETDIAYTMTTYGTVYKVSRVGLCARPGDSGAPIFRSGKAYGVLSGGSISSVCNDFRYYTGMGPIINGYNGNISLF